jgi:hypothetical protein
MRCPCTPATVRRWRAPLLLPAALAAACAPTKGGPGAEDSGPAAFSYPDAGAMPPLRGPGGPARSFTEAELFQPCAALAGGENDFLHHNLVVPYRGHLVMPWSPEFSTGGLTFFDMSDPCAPVKDGEGWDQLMRESHALGFLHLPEGDPQAGDYAVTTGALGIQIWNITDVSNPYVLHYLQLPGVLYPDAYARVVLSVSWQHPWLYVAGADNGVYIVDTSDLAAPALVTQLPVAGVRAGGVFVMGDLMLVTPAEGTESALFDVGTPDQPQPIPGGRFSSMDADGQIWESYHGNLVGDMALYARKEGAGGLMVMDVSDPTQPRYFADLPTSGNGGYVFYDEGFAFIGNSDTSHVLDMRDPTNITIVGEGQLPGDLDTLTPYGNVAVMSVDEEAEDGVASAVMAWTLEPDTAPPEVLRIRPVDGATGISPAVRVGVGLNEFVEPSSVFAGSIRLWHADGRAVDGWGSGQEAIATFTPKEPLEAGVTYTVEVVAGGLRDLDGNALASTVTSQFTVAGAR